MLMDSFFITGSRSVRFIGFLLLHRRLLRVNNESNFLSQRFSAMFQSQLIPQPTLSQCRNRNFRCNYSTTHFATAKSKLVGKKVAVKKLQLRNYLRSVTAE